MTSVNHLRVAELRATAEKLTRLADDLEIEASENINTLNISGIVKVKRSMFPGLSSTELLNQAKFIYESRRKRARYIEDDIFGEPAWDIILDLLISKLSGKRISVTSSCMASAVAPTTALRWLKHLEEYGIVIRENCLTDNRRSYVSLSDSTFNSLVKYFSEVREFREKSDIYLGDALIVNK